MNIIHQVVDRCHVGMSNKTVIRYAISRLKNRDETFWGMEKSNRKLFIKSVVERHLENIKLYVDIQNGRI